MPYDRTIQIPAQQALAAFVKSGILTGAIADHASGLAERWTDAGAAAKAAFATTHEPTRVAIHDRIDYAQKGGNLYVKVGGLDDAIADLAPIAITASARTGQIKAAIERGRAEGNEPTDEDIARFNAALKAEQEASILLSLATGARILTLTVADWSDLQRDDGEPA